MKYKLIIAREPESSTTVRIKPKDLSELLNKCNLEAFEEVMTEYMFITKMYKPDIIVQKRLQVLSNLIKKEELCLDCLL
jgi:hypothetical protein